MYLWYSKCILSRFGVKNSSAKRSSLEFLKFVWFVRYTGSSLSSLFHNSLNNMSCIRTILDKLIYLDKHEYIDKNMTDSNVGARKGRNIRDHLFIVNGILNSVKHKEMSNIDIQIYCYINTTTFLSTEII